MSDDEFAQDTGAANLPDPGAPCVPPTQEERAWVDAMARRRTRVPKGLFRYTSMEQANADWERWHAEMATESVSVEP
jgi:hypothetical protein